MKITGLVIAISALTLAYSSARATVVTLDFEGLKNNERINSFYNGGTGGSGSSGENYGISFTEDSLAYISKDSGGTGEFRNNPSGKTIILFEKYSTGDVVTVAAGFTGTLSFYYCTPLTPEGSITIRDGLNGSGNVLKSFDLESTLPLGTGLAYDNWKYVSVAFDGTAKSINFSGIAGYAALDNITLDINSCVPEASTWLAGIGCLFPLLGAFFRKFRK